MLTEITAEILQLSKDSKFVRNLSCISLLAIACLFGLSDLQSQSNRVLFKNSYTYLKIIDCVDN